jgi:hypothetical protein
MAVVVEPLFDSRIIVYVYIDGHSPPVLASSGNCSESPFAVETFT